MMSGLRSQILFAALLLVVTAWSLDFLSAKVGPQAAQALVVANLPDDPDGIAAEDLQAVLTALRSTPSARPPIELGERSLFAQSVTPQPAQTAQTEPGKQPSTPAETVEPVPPAIPDLELHGILRGRQRMAVINGAVYTRGQHIDDYQVISIGREVVVLHGPAGRVRLQLMRPSLQSGND